MRPKEKISLIDTQVRKILGRFKVADSINNNRKIPYMIRDVFRTQSNI